MFSHIAKNNLFLNLKGMFAVFGNKKYNLIKINRKGRSIKPVFRKNLS